MTQTERRIVPIADVCVCGHWQGEHESDCAYGWSGEANELEPCDCTEYRVDYTLVMDRP